MFLSSTRKPANPSLSYVDLLHDLLPSSSSNNLFSFTEKHCNVIWAYCIIRRAVLDCLFAQRKIEIRVCVILSLTMSCLSDSKQVQELI